MYTIRQINKLLHIFREIYIVHAVENLKSIVTCMSETKMVMASEYHSLTTNINQSGILYAIVN